MTSLQPVYGIRLLVHYPRGNDHSVVAVNADSLWASLIWGIT